MRARHLPRLIAIWPEEIADETKAGDQRILERLRHALRSERRRGRSGHWSYDLNRHWGLIRAYKAELSRLNGRADKDTLDAASRQTEPAIP